MKKMQKSGNRNETQQRLHTQDMAKTFKVVKRVDTKDPKVLLQERDGERTRADRDGTNWEKKTCRDRYKKK
jgi:hypothetical protein